MENRQNGHNKDGQLGALKGLMYTKHFGAKKGARRAEAMKKALYKKQDKDYPF